jgi:hypothetical protein
VRGEEVVLTLLHRVHGDRLPVCNYHCLYTVLRIRDVYPGSVFFPSRTPDPNFINPETRIRIKEFKYLNPKKWFLSTQEYDPGCSCRIRIPDPEPDFLPIPDPVVRKASDPGSATLSLYFYLPSVFRIPKILIGIRILGPRQDGGRIRLVNWWLSRNQHKISFLSFSA